MNFENIIDRASELARTGVSKVAELTQTGVAKAKELSEIAKLKMNNSTEEDNIRRAYVELGKLYYAERGMAPEAAYSALCEKVTESKEKIAYNDEKIEDIKAAGDIKDAEIEDLVTDVPPEEPIPTITPEGVSPEETKE